MQIFANYLHKNYQINVWAPWPTPLGIMLDNKLKFNKNAEYVLKKLNKKLGFLKRIGYKMNEFSRILYYKSLIQPHFDYCSVLFHMMDKGWMKKFETIQRKFIKAVKLKKDILNYDDVFKEIKITRVIILILKLM